MINMTVDIIRIPVDEYGCLKYDFETVKSLLDNYRKIKPNQPVICIPEDIQILQNQNIESLINFRNQINIIIKEME